MDNWAELPLGSYYINGASQNQMPQHMKDMWETK